MRPTGKTYSGSSPSPAAALVHFPTADRRNRLGRAEEIGRLAISRRSLPRPSCARGKNAGQLS